MRSPLLLALVAGLVSSGCSKPSGAETSPTALAAAKDPKAAVAVVDGAQITEGELMTEARPSLTALERKFAEETHSQKVQALDRLIERRLLETRARKEGITVEALLDREVNSKVQEPSEEMMQSVYDQTRASGRALPPFPNVKSEIAAFVKAQSAQELRQAFVGRLRTESRVETHLPPLLLPKTSFAATGPARGEAEAPVTIVEFSDYECQFCGVAAATLKTLLAEYKGKVRLVHQPFPLSMHANAPKASEAAFCAGEQGRYWEMHDALFAQQDALGITDLKSRAKALGLDSPRFDSCLDSGRMGPAVAASKKLGEGIGVSSTPAFFVNGRPLSGSQPIERFRELVDHELREAAH